MPSPRYKFWLAFALGFLFISTACYTEPTLTQAPSNPTASATPLPFLSPTESATEAVTETATEALAETNVPTPQIIDLAFPTPTSTTVAERVGSPAAPTRPPVTGPVVTLSACATIWEPGYYKLTTDIKTPETDCFYVQSNNVVFDCDNHSIEGRGYGGYAFFVRKWGFPIQQTPTNIEIKNCRVSHHRTGIFVGGGNNVYVHHNDLSDNFDTVNKARFGDFLGMTEGGGLRFDTVRTGRAEFNTTNRQAIGIDIRDSDHITVRNNTAAGNSAWGISLLNTSYSQVSNNTTKDNIRYCAWGDGTVGRGCDAGGIILQDGASHNVVSDNSVTGENGNGIFIKAHASRCGNDNLIENNRIIDAVYNAIEFSFCDGNRVIGNEITGSYDAVWFGFSTNTVVQKNTIRNMTNHGVISFNSHNSLITENRITNSRDGIYFYWEAWDAKRFFFLPPSPDNYASRDNLIQGNVLSQNSVAAIHLSNSIRNRVIGNTFADNGKTIWLEGKTDGTVTQ